MPFFTAQYAYEGYMYQMIGRFAWRLPGGTPSQADAQNISGTELLRDVFAIGSSDHSDLKWFNLLVISGFILVTRLAHYKLFTLAVASNKLQSKK